MIRKILLGAGAIALLAGTTAPASAQVGDFFCSTLSVFCPDPPPPPPPAPMAEAPPEPVKHRVKKHKAVKKAKAKKEAAEPAAAPQ